MIIKEIQDPMLPEMDSKTWGIFKNTNEDPVLYISINHENDFPEQNTKNQLVIWNEEQGELFSINIEA